MNLEASTASAQMETIATEERQNEKLSGLALLAVQWCKDDQFQEWLSMEVKVPVMNEIAASNNIKAWCNIDSRKELNTNPAAAAIFNSEIRAPFAEWLRQKGKGQI